VITREVLVGGMVGFFTACFVLALFDYLRWEVQGRRRKPIAEPCLYCHGESPSSDGLTECGWCDDGVLRYREWWMSR
jgi:hypothetical protein